MDRDDWNVTKNEDIIEALKLFYEMKLIGVNLITFTITSALPACADIAVLHHGKEIHGYIII